MFSSLDDPRLTDRARQQYAACNETAGLVLPLIAKNEVIGTVELLVTRGERVFMQVAPGNVASLRAVLAAGFHPIGAEVLFLKDGGAPR